MRLVDEISKSSANEISEAIMYAFARTAVRDALDGAVEATGANDWGGRYRLFPHLVSVLRQGVETVAGR